MEHILQLSKKENMKNKSIDYRLILSYYMSMDNLKIIIGENLSELRKEKKLTQLELADKFGYSDKAISKWEKGDTLPDIETLSDLCDFYGVTLDYLTHENEDREQFRSQNKKQEGINKITIICLLVSLVWMLATIIYVYSLISTEASNPFHNYWLVFLWAIPLSCLVVIGMNRIYYRKKVIYFWCFSTLVWTAITCFFLQFIEFMPWPLFILGIPMQISLILWLGIKPRVKK